MFSFLKPAEEKTLTVGKALQIAERINGCKCIEKIFSDRTPLEIIEYSLSLRNMHNEDEAFIDCTKNPKENIEKD